MGLFSTLLLQTTSSGTGTGTTSSINNDTSIIGSTSSNTSINSTNTSSGSNIGNLPTVVQLYTKHPIPIFAVDTSVVASEDMLNDLTQQQQQQQQQKKAMMKKYSINHWFTTTSTSTANISYTKASVSVSSFAPLQYYAVQCIPYQDYYGEKSLLGSILNTSSSTTAAALDPSNPSTSTSVTTTNANTTTTIPSSSLRNTISSKQYQDLTMKYIHPDLGIYNCNCSSSSVSTSSSSSSLIDAMIPLTLQPQQSNGSNESISSSTSSMNSSNQVFCMVVDMTSSQQYVFVESNITTIQQALIRCLIQYSNLFTVNMNDKSKNSNTNSNTNTKMTSLEQLKLVQFGLANNDDSSKSSSKTTTTTNENDQNICITLQICVMMDRSHNQNSNNNNDNNNNNNKQDTIDTSSTTSTTMNYHTQQLKQLLMYHLRKYAAALNASLVFVSTDMTSSTTSSSLVNDESGLAQQQQYQYQPTVNIRELPWIWKALANGIPVWNYDSIDAIETGRMIISNNVDATSAEISNLDKDNTTITETKSTDSTNSNNNNLYSLIYGPDNHNTEWIESVLVRNANYVGHWDAMKDSIWKILIPPKSTTNITNTMKTKEEMKINDGDQIWLQELYDSIVPVMTSSSSTTTTSTSMSNDATLQTPPPKKGGSSTSSAVRPQSSMSKNKTATPNDAAVSSFFEDLLK